MQVQEIFDKTTMTLQIIGMPIVQCYHLICGSVFLNTAAEDAQGLEQIGNYLLAPVQYFLAGHTAVKLSDGSSVETSDGYNYKLVQRFDYSKQFALKMTSSALALPFSLVVGSFVKAMSYLFSETRVRHQQIAYTIDATHIELKNDYYRSLGMAVEDLRTAARLDPPVFKRRPEDESVLSAEREALKAISDILKEANIPFWLDCGTCLGAYRYGGAIPWDYDVDIAILAPDFENARRALNALDNKKYAVQDWSGRSIPGSYLKVYVRETGGLIDIYHVAIDAEKKQLASILSNEESPLLPEFWKIRERRYIHPIPFDMVFPLKIANFDGLEVPVPNKTKEYLQSKFGENIDPAKVYDEKTGRYEKDLNHPYWQRSYVH